MTLELHGYSPSVYSWIARLALHEKSVEYLWREVDPFADDVPAYYLEANPFGRVPTLFHDGFVLYETVAIVRYVDEIFPGPSLQPDSAKGRARALQIASVVDAHAYRPLVRQVFSHDVWRPLHGEPSDEAEIDAGLAAAPTVLSTLDGFIGDDGFAVGGSLSLADLHLAPMIAYFAASGPGRALLHDHSSLDAWWSRTSRRPSVRETNPLTALGLPDPARRNGPRRATASS